MFKATVYVWWTGFYYVSGYHFLIFKFAVVPPMGRCQKVGVQKLVSDVQLLRHEPIFWPIVVTASGKMRTTDYTTGKWLEVGLGLRLGSGLRLWFRLGFRQHAHAYCLYIPTVYVPQLRSPHLRVASGWTVRYELLGHPTCRPTHFLIRHD